jgi:hypothetical protein
MGPVQFTIRAVTEREARVLYLFDPEIHKNGWDERKGHITSIQTVLASSAVT